MRIKRPFQLCLIAEIVALFLTGCLPDADVLKDIKPALLPEMPVVVKKPTSISDIQEFPQDVMAYLDPFTLDDVKIPRYIQEVINTHFDQRYFAPWTEKPEASRDSLERVFIYYADHPGFGENKLPREPQWVDSLHQNAALDSFPNTQKRAISIQNASLRGLPTEKPLFNDFEIAGEGYPFDTLQTSGVPANCPLYVFHMSKDNAWAYVMSPLASGWMATSQLAWVDSKAIRQIQKGPFGSLIKDRMPILAKNKLFLFEGYIGMQFPITSQTKQTMTVLAATANDKRQAVLKEVVLPKSVIAAKPLPVTTGTIATLANEMMAQPYGWGDLYQNRDCSSMIKSLFAPFGIWLPRNSSYQAKGGFFINLKDLFPADKERMIVQNGIPYLTLIWLKGHIMLYIGHQNGKAVVLHNIWGIRTRDFLGKEGRMVIGKTVITSLEPGKEIPHYDSESSLLKRVEGMTLLVPRYQ